MPATGWTTSSSRSSVSPPPPSPPDRARRGACGRGTAGRAGPGGHRRRRRCRCGSAGCSAGRRCLVFAVLLGVRLLVGPVAWPSSSPACRLSLASWPLVLLRVPLTGRARCRCEAPRRSRRAGPAARPAWVGALLGRRSRGLLGGASDTACRRGVGGVAVGRHHGSAAIGLAPPLTDGGDEFALAHPGHTLDADLAGERPQFRQHHGGQRPGAIARGDVAAGRSRLRRRRGAGRAAAAERDV